MALQSMHFILSWLGAWLRWLWLVQLTDAMTYCIASLGMYVTIQFFVLVLPHPAFAERCAQFARKGRPIRNAAIAAHIPGILLAILDIREFKDPARLHKSCSLQASYCMIFAYVVMYVGLISLNNKATGDWPYSILRGLTSTSKWATFVILQSVVISGFCFCLWSLTEFRVVESSFTAIDAFMERISAR
eukprot:TRINITY_DN36127_c0_g1_i3.p2 TRINITY_DN36127_c0_g1~~TRINITY_DN36127_c0_g1_i3.p2  ORF type:complete len:189 (-),score=10.04 TRINITY_DN36127_c0_g1_i3:180-746(-)